MRGVLSLMFLLASCVPAPNQGARTEIKAANPENPGGDTGGTDGDTGGTGGTGGDTGGTGGTGGDTGGTGGDTGGTGGTGGDTGGTGGDTGGTGGDIDGTAASWTIADSGDVATEGSLGVCGNGVRDRGEVCDDGNTIPGDGCSNTCLRDGPKVRPAFPGAEGFAAKTRGGRGGKVYTVTTLNWSGPGSFREAMNHTHPRIIVFAVSGVIKVPTDATTLNLGPQHSYVTVAGQTSPGGITFQGTSGGATTIWSYPDGEGAVHRAKVDNSLQFHDAVFQHLRFRGQTQEDNVSMAAVHNIIFDHCDFSGANDEALDITFAHDITIQWSTISNSGYPGGGNGYGALIAYYPTSNLTMHHNLQNNHSKRCGVHFHWEDEGHTPPGGAYFDFRNNILHNCGHHVFYYPGYITERRDMFVNLVGNTASVGPNTHLDPNPDTPTDTIGFIGAGTGAKLFFKDNDTQDRYSQPNRKIAYPKRTAWGSEPVELTEETKMAPVTTQPRAEAYAAVLAKAGAWPRDAMNKRSVKEIEAGTGQLGDSQTPLLTEGPAAPADSDGDGMPDAWESKQGLDPNQDDAAGDLDKDGWTNIEEYLYARAEQLIEKP